MTKYQRMKAKARDRAIEFQRDMINSDMSMLDIAQKSNEFYTLGKRYGLLKEFHENGIC